MSATPDTTPAAPDAGPAASQSPAEAPRADRFGLLQAGLLGLRAGPALILLVLVGVIGATTPIFLTGQNVGNVFSQTSVIAMLALGQLMVIITRGIDLSVGSTIALAGVTGAVAYQHVHSTFLIIVIIVGVGVAVGAVNGLVFVYGRVPHPFIVTLATRSIVSGLALWAAKGQLVPGMPNLIQTVGGSQIGGHPFGWLPYSILVVFALALMAHVLMTRMTWGRWLYMVGGDLEAARRSGVPVRRVLVSVYVLSGLAAGLGGLMTAGLIASGSPTAGDGIELDAIAAVIIGGAAFAGGRGSVSNALVGAFTIGVIRNALNLHNVDPFYQLMAIGVVVLLAVEADVIRSHVEGRVRVAQARRQT